ncbi:MSMEG_4193 family putative phosphomutase [Anaerolineales bacterium HSG6]|nr:MSMEG_4193 family putative phosphomutase [Anaerolineales bacterium HSG6]MDM8532816.1 MSMEG_4193 family putative phosphomutase [Anaerolineales bacterium HSG25]
MSKSKNSPTTILLIRHGENNWTETHKLAGRTAGVYLNDYGKQQALALGERLSNSTLHTIYASPLERTVETAEAIAKHHAKLEIQLHPGIIEVDYGDWTGEPISKLAKKEAWSKVQFCPSGASFPEGETMYDMQARMVQVINRLVKKHGGETIAIVGHADLIKGALAHYLGVHFDLFQRIMISTASISTIRFHGVMPRVECVNDTNHNPSRAKKHTKK